MKRDPIKVLFLSANSDTSTRLRTDLEFRRIETLLRTVELSGRLEIILRVAVQVPDLQREILQNKPDIVHFSGHGTAKGEIEFEGPDGTSQFVAKEALVKLFGLLKGRLRIVVLNACCSEPLAKAITEHVDFTIGMSDTIKDRAAIVFSEALYQALGHGKSVKDAFDLGVNALHLLRHPDADVPTLAARSGVDASTVVLVEPIPTQRPPAGGGDAAAVTLGENVVLFLDLASDNPVSMDEVQKHLPDGRPTKEFRATKFGAKQGPGGAVDFPACADAIQRMVATAREGRGPDAPNAHFYVVGRAALPVFAHLGMELSAWADVTLLNRRKEGFWDVLSLQDPAPKEGELFFKTVLGLEATRPSLSDGRVAVFVSTNYPPNEEAIFNFLKERGETPAGIIEVRTEAGRNTLLDTTNTARVMNELVQVFNRIRDVYPRTKKLALFIAGPATLAFMATRAINRNIFGDVWVPNYEGGVYHPAAELPWKGRVRSEVSATPEGNHDRIRILGKLCSCVRELQQKLRREHLPPVPIVTEDEVRRVLQRIKEINVAEEPQGEVFDLRVSERKLSFGTGLLEAFRSMQEKDWKRAGQLIFLHEVFHFDQNLQSPLHEGVGRAGFALEEVDYWADAMAVGTLAKWEISRGGEEAEEQLREIVPAHVDAVLSGIEAFDRFEHGARIDKLGERRLRRYLIWHLQRARAATLRSVDDLWQLFGCRLLVEMAPLKGHLDDRFDKIVATALPQTEIFVALPSRMMRIPAQPHRGIDPSAMVEAVRTYDRRVLGKVMEAVRESHRQILTPWAV